MKCDRCGDEADYIPIFWECSTCGPVPLCPRCAVVHRRELEEEAAE